MTIHSFKPSPLLFPFVRKYLIIESQDEMTNRVLPDISLAMTFQLKGHIHYISDSAVHQIPTAVLTGLRKSSRLIHYQKNSATFIVLFREVGAHVFFKDPLQELFNESIPLDDYIDHKVVHAVEEQLFIANNNIQRMAVIENFLLSRLKNPKQDNLVLSAVQKIGKANGQIRIKSLTESLYISPDAFEKRFRKSVGTTPKQFSSIVRMKSIINVGAQAQKFTDLALNEGYYDQPHFNKDFKLFTGQTPTAYFASLPSW